MENKFIDGIRSYAPHEKAPDFVICEQVVTLEDLQNFFSNNSQHVKMYNGKKQLRITTKRAKSGAFYCELNTYQASGQNKSVTGTKTNNTPHRVENDGLPF